MATFKHSCGFTLIELSVVLIIIAVLVGSGLSIAIAQLDVLAEKETRMKMAIINEAISGYIKRNNRLPCPSNPSLTPDNASYGVQTTPSTCVPSAAIFAADHRGGAVPVRTLNLPDEYIFDGWGNKITYIINRNLTAAGAFTTYTITNTSLNTLPVCDTTALTQRSPAALVLISHGKNGYGAYSRSGTAPGAYPATADSANAWVNATTYGTNGICMLDKEYYDGIGTSEIFDDIVISKTRAQLRTNSE